MDKMNLLRDHISKMEVMQLATTVANQPWACTVHFIYLDTKFYWMSLQTTRHSREIAQNPKVAIALAIQTKQPLIGVQVEGDAAIVDDPAEVDKLVAAFAERQGWPEDRTRASLNSTPPWSFYCFTPRTFVLFDKQNFPDSPHQEWQA